MTLTPETTHTRPAQHEEELPARLRLAIVRINNDLQPFEWIVPCGIDGCRMTSLCRELEANQEMDAFMDTVTERFGGVYERAPVPLSAGELAERAGLETIGAMPTPSSR